jgi:hypothetical protein
VRNYIAYPWTDKVTVETITFSGSAGDQKLLNVPIGAVAFVVTCPDAVDENDENIFVYQTGGDKKYIPLGNTVGLPSFASSYSYPARVYLSHTAASAYSVFVTYFYPG